MPLRITVEMIPHGDESRKHTIGVMEIANTGKHPHRPTYGEYHWRMTGPVHGGDIEEWHKGTLSAFRRSRGYWACISEILNLADIDHEPLPESEAHDES